MGEATNPVKLKEPGEVASTYIWTEVCHPHWEQLFNKSVEWVLEIGKNPMNPKWHQQTLIVGPDLQALDERVIQSPPTLKDRPDLYSRIFSNNDEDGPHIQLSVRQRGGEDTETLTVVVPRSEVDGLIRLLTDWRDSAK